MIARLSGTASRHVPRGWRQPTGEQIAAAVAELRAITTDPELLAEEAGLLYGTGCGSSYERRKFIAAGYLVAAGADPDWIWYWAIIGRERAERAKRALAAR